MSASGGGGGECTRGDWWGQRWWGARSHILTSWTMCRGADWGWSQVIGGDLWIAYLETLTWKGQIGQSEKSHKNTTGLIQLLQPSFESNKKMAKLTHCFELTTCEIMAWCGIYVSQYLETFFPSIFRAKTTTSANLLSKLVFSLNYCSVK